MSSGRSHRPGSSSSYRDDDRYRDRHYHGSSSSRYDRPPGDVRSRHDDPPRQHRYDEPSRHHRREDGGSRRSYRDRRDEGRPGSSRREPEPPAPNPTPQLSAEELEKARLRKERLEAWKKQKEAKKLAEQKDAPAPSAPSPKRSPTSPTRAKQTISPTRPTDVDPLATTTPFSTTAAKPLARKTGLFTNEEEDATKRPKLAALHEDSTMEEPETPVMEEGTKEEEVDEFEEDDVRMARERSLQRQQTAERSADSLLQEEEDKMDESAEAGPPPSTTEEKPSHDAEEEDVDPLDAFMLDVDKEVVAMHEADQNKTARKAARQEKRNGSPKPVKEEEEEEEEEEAPVVSDEEEDDILKLARAKAKKKDLASVDHSKMEYEFFRKDFWVEPTEMAKMTTEEVNAIREDLGNIKIRGKNCPKPVLKWSLMGLPSGCDHVIKASHFKAPTPIQAQAVPAIMSGRDVIGVAKTGSGKTVAFLLPMLRHIKDQRPLTSGEGPIGLIMTPTRELAVQIYNECRRFTKHLNLKVVCAYGGSPIKDNIADLKRGPEIVVCTPGRMIDVLCANSGRVTNLRRVTYLVLDEADRMFDLGFEPQVMKIVNNVRPSRQTVMFSATFPRQMEALARKILKRPLEITVGEKSVVASDITQVVEVLEEDAKFARLLEILGNWNDDTKDQRLLIFTDRQEAADHLLKDLFARGYPCNSLHGGKDQMDRDSTISDFKAGIFRILVATSVAARGLDVKNLNVVVNYECPNHMEDYVHRVGRTGRAGNKGSAFTFITRDQERFAADIATALTNSQQEVPEALADLVKAFKEKVKSGNAKQASSGYGGKGLEKFEKERDATKKLQKKGFGTGAGAESSDDSSSDEEEDALQDQRKEVTSFRTSLDEAFARPVQKRSETVAAPEKPVATIVSNAAGLLASGGGADGAKKTADVIAALNARHKAEQIASNLSSLGPKDINAAEFSFELEINDFPQKARWRATNKEMISRIVEQTGASITTRGLYQDPSKPVDPNVRKLYLVVEGEKKSIVEAARKAIKDVLVEAVASSLEEVERRGGASSGKYSVV